MVRPAGWTAPRSSVRSPDDGGARRGFALETTLIVIVMLSTLTAAAMFAMTSRLRTVGIDYRGARVSSAAEAGSDAVMAQLLEAMDDGVVTDSELTVISAPTLSGYSFTVSAQRIGIPKLRPVTDGPFAGLLALTQRVDVLSRARDPQQHESAVIVSAKTLAIPLFQFGVFYDRDLEILPGPPMTFAGRVHTNGNLYVESDSVTFQSVISTVGSFVWQRKDHNQRRTGVYINNSSGTPVRVTFDSRSVPVPDDFRAMSERYFDSRLLTDAHGVRPMRLPIPSAMSPITLIAPRDPGDNTQLRNVKLAWKADWHIEVDRGALGPGVCAAMVHTRTGALEVPDAASCAAIFSATTDAFHDGRENIGVDVFQIDMAALRNWVQLSPATRATRTFYVTFIGAAGADYPAVRLVNGGELPNALTVATDRPVYVQGDYNTVAWKPAALLSDAITFLSNAWSDADHPWDPAWNPAVTQAYPLTFAAPLTAVHAAILAGHSGTGCDWMDCGANQYGGGLENFPRFLESWGNLRTMLYRGSLVSLFEPQYANRHPWAWRSYYVPPARDWQFDPRFMDPDFLPPSSPVVSSVAQLAYRPVY